MSCHFFAAAPPILKPQLALPRVKLQHCMLFIICPFKITTQPAYYILGRRMRGSQMDCARPNIRCDINNTADDLRSGCDPALGLSSGRRMTWSVWQGKHWTNKYFKAAVLQVIAVMWLHLESRVRFYWLFWDSVYTVHTMKQWHRWRGDCANKTCYCNKKKKTTHRSILSSFTVGLHHLTPSQ